MNSFYDRRFELYVMLAGENTRRPWKFATWKALSALMESRVISCRGTPAIRCTQEHKTTKVDLKFGRLGWSEKDFAKWTHGSPETLKRSQAWHFLDMELWCPSWKECERGNTAPEIFLTISTVQNEPGLINYVLLLALASEMFPDETANRQFVRAIKRRLHVKLCAHKPQRRWGIYNRVDESYDSCINDIPVVGLFRPGLLEAPLTLRSLQGNWTAI